MFKQPPSQTTIELSPSRAEELIASGGLLVDVRDKSERDIEMIKDSASVPLTDLKEGLSHLDLPDQVIFYCAVGVRSAKAAEEAQELYPEKEFFSLKGGLTADITPLVLVQEETTVDLSRYSRQILLPELGIKGQEKLLSSKVLIIGLGGLGSPAAFYLAAAGVSLGLVDDDIVDKTNLQRQIVHKNDSVGIEKTISAKNTLLELNPDISISTYSERLNPDNIDRIMNGYDLVLDGADNFDTRYLINDKARELKIPVVSASILGFWGQVTTFLPDGPCYRCLYPEPPPDHLAPACSVAGVIGAVAGIAGAYQANEAIKVLAGIGETLSGKILVFQMLENNVFVLKSGPRPDCPVCQKK